MRHATVFRGALPRTLPNVARGGAVWRITADYRVLGQTAACDLEPARAAHLALRRVAAFQGHSRAMPRATARATGYELPCSVACYPALPSWQPPLSFCGPASARFEMRHVPTDALRGWVAGR
eukprot:12141828-Alexandrium_andersonii.AAC.1